MPIKVRKQILKNKAKEPLTPAEADLIAKVNSLATSWSQRLVKWKRGVKAGEPILVASDCSGYGSDLIALTLLGLRNKVKSVLVCDKDPKKRMLHEAVVESCGIAVSKTAVCNDMFSRDNSQVESPHVYTAGYPCPSYSNLGKKRGTKDGRGLATLKGLEFIAEKRPQVVVLEQVSALLQKRFKKVWTFILKVLGLLGYTVRHSVMNTKDYGIPQSRPRLYVVAVVSECCPKNLKNFFLPEGRKDKLHLHHFLAKDVVGNETLELPHYEQKLGADLWRKGFVVDIGCSTAFAHHLVNLCPCLTYSRLRQAGYYIPKLKRRLTVGEAAGLQGVPQQILTCMLAKAKSNNKPESAVAAALGDAMSINVLMVALSRGLETAGLSDLGQKKDFWLLCPPDKCHQLADNLFKKNSRES